jgi:hypothetical protein
MSIAARVAEPDEARVEFRLARLQREIDRLEPEARHREVLRIRLQILRNAIGLVKRLTAPARAAFLEWLDDLADCVGVRLAGGAR